MLDVEFCRLYNGLQARTLILCFCYDFFTMIFLFLQQFAMFFPAIFCRDLLLYIKMEFLAVG